MRGWGLRTPVGDTRGAVWGQEASEDRGEGTGGHIGDTVGAVGDTVGTHWGQLGTHVQPAAVADGEGSQQSIVGLQAGQQLPASSTQLQLHPRGRNPHHQLQLLLWGHTGSYRVTQGSYRVPQSPMGCYGVLRCLLDPSLPLPTPPTSSSFGCGDTQGPIGPSKDPRPL